MKEKLFGVFWVVSVPLVWVVMGVLFSCTKCPETPTPVPTVVPTAPPPPTATPVEACTSWEYKTLYAKPVKTPGRDTTTGGELPASVTPNDADLTKEGKDGWELAGTYMEVETGFASMQDKSVQPNVRPQRLVMIFKRLACPK